MWKPDAVVPEHRWRARMVWVSLLVGITAYTIWLIWKIFDDRANPSTSLKITNDLFAYPYVLVCFYHGQGCGFTDTSVDTCVSTALTESTTVYFKDDSYGDLGAYALGNCVSFDLGSLEFGDDITTENDEVTIDMWWIQSDMASDETDYFDHIGMYMAEEEPTESTSSFLHVPYSRILPDVEVIYTVAELSIGKTTKKALNGDVTTTFPPLVLSSSDYTANETWTTSEDDALSDPAYGRLFLVIDHGDFSLTTIAEVDPLNIGTVLGNIGGFWELLLVLWGLFFIATQEERKPKMKARDFAKTVQTAKKYFTRRRSLSVDSAAASMTSAVEQRPQWEAAFRGDTAAVPQLGGDNTAVQTVPPVNDGGASTAIRRASNDSRGNGSTSSARFHRATSGMTDPHGSSSSFNFRRPVVLDMPRRGSRTGGSLPEVQPRAPPSHDEMSAK